MAKKKTAAPKSRKRAAKKKAGKKKAARKSTAKERALKEHADEKRETQAQLQVRLSKMLGGPVTREAARQWLSKGYPLHDAAALRAILLEQRTCPDWLIRPETPIDSVNAGQQGNIDSDDDRETMPTAAELRYQLLLENVRLTAANATKKELEAEAAKHKWMTSEQAKEGGRAISAIFRSHLLQIPNQWTPILDGMPPGKMREKMRAEVARILGDVLRLLEERGARVGTISDVLEELALFIAEGSLGKRERLEVGGRLKELTALLLEK